MTQLIISIYDSWYGGRVYSNGKRNYPMEMKIKKAYDHTPRHYWWEHDIRLSFNDWVLKEYGSLYENIIICEDGGIEVLK